MYKRQLHIRQAEVVDLVIEEQGIGNREQGTEDEGLRDSGTSGLRAEQLAELPRPARRRGRVLGLKLRDGRNLLAGATIITTGTFLNGLIHCGEERYPAGRSGEPASVLLGEALRALGLRTCRLKTCLLYTSRCV